MTRSFLPTNNTNNLFSNCKTKGFLGKLQVEENLRLDEPILVGLCQRSEPHPNPPKKGRSHKISRKMSESEEEYIQHDSDEDDEDDEAYEGYRDLYNYEKYGNYVYEDDEDNDNVNDEDIDQEDDEDNDNVNDEDIDLEDEHPRKKAKTNEAETKFSYIDKKDGTKAKTNEAETKISDIDKKDGHPSRKVKKNEVETKNPSEYSLAAKQIDPKKSKTVWGRLHVHRMVRGKAEKSPLFIANLDKPLLCSFGSSTTVRGDAPNLAFVNGGQQICWEEWEGCHFTIQHRIVTRPADQTHPCPWNKHVIVLRRHSTAAIHVLTENGLVLLDQWEEDCSEEDTKCHVSEDTSIKFRLNNENGLAFVECRFFKNLQNIPDLPQIIETTRKAVRAREASSKKNAEGWVKAVQAAIEAKSQKQKEENEMSLSEDVLRSEMKNKQEEIDKLEQLLEEAHAKYYDAKVQLASLSKEKETALDDAIEKLKQKTNEMDALQLKVEQLTQSERRAEELRTQLDAKHNEILVAQQEQSEMEKKFNLQIESLQAELQQLKQNTSLNEEVRQRLASTEEALRQRQEELEHERASAREKEKEIEQSIQILTKQELECQQSAIDEKNQMHQRLGQMQMEINTLTSKNQQLRKNQEKILREEAEKTARAEEKQRNMMEDLGGTTWSIAKLERSADAPPFLRPYYRCLQKYAQQDPDLFSGKSNETILPKGETVGVTDYSYLFHDANPAQFQLVKFLEYMKTNVTEGANWVAGFPTRKQMEAQVPQEFEIHGFKWANDWSKPKHEEDLVDPTLVAIVNTATLKSHTPTFKLGRPGKFIVVSGDGNDNEGRPSFFEAVVLALSWGWEVELWAWNPGKTKEEGGSMSFKYLNGEFMKHHINKGTLVINNLASFNW